MVQPIGKKPGLAPPPRGTGLRHPVLALGFRPFFLLAGIFAVAIIPLWLAVYVGWLALPTRLWPNG